MEFGKKLAPIFVSLLSSLEKPANSLIRRKFLLQREKREREKNICNKSREKNGLFKG